MASRPEMILCTLGTRGDVEPFLLVGAALHRRGYQVSLLSNCNWRDLAEGAGLGFESIADEDQSQSGRDDHLFFLDSTLPSFDRSFRWIARKAESGRKLMLLHRSNMLGAQCAARKFGIPNGRLILQPSALKSCERPPWPLSILTEGRLGWIARKLIVPAVYAAGAISSPYRRHNNGFRRSVGLPARPPWHPPEHERDYFMIMLCPAWFAQPQSDWPRNLYLAGFPFAAAGELDRELLGFIEAHGPPLVFTPGTGVDDTGPFFDRAAELADRSGISAVFLSRHIPQRRRGTASIICRDFVDLGALLPRAAAFFHHGGIGSTAQALRAGTPQLVVPGRFDQPDNAMRVARLGLGAAIFSDRCTAADWEDLLRRTLSSQHVRTQLATVKALLARQDAVANCVDIVEHFAGRYVTGNAEMRAAA